MSVKGYKIIISILITIIRTCTTRDNPHPSLYKKNSNLRTLKSSVFIM